jgi:glycerophosphoryl diester phosphodiesterase
MPNTMNKTVILTAMMAMAALSAAASPKVVAHRGYWNAEGSAQNSIRSLVKADSVGCYASEFDVWLTADDVLVVNHDKTISGIEIESAQSDTLLQQRLANGETLPTLESYLDAAKALKIELVLEVKPHSDEAHENKAVDMILQMVADKGLQERTTYITFSRNALLRLVESANRPVYYLTSVEPDILFATHATGPDYNIKFLRQHPEWLETFKSAGLPINVWTVSDDEGLQWCIDNNVDYITTNAPERAMQLINENKSAK